MSRIRSIKPEFWTSAQVLECSTNARLLFIGLWNFADDAGRHPYSAKQAKAEVFPADQFTEEQIFALLTELEINQLIVRYSHDGKDYFYISGWKHQRIDKPQLPKYPDPFSDHSKNDLRTIPPDTIGEDRIGEDTKVIEREAREPLISPEAFELSDSVLKSMEADREAPEWSGFPYIVQTWLNQTIPKDFIMATCAGLRGKHRNYLDKAVLNGWRDRQNDQQTQGKRVVSNGTSTGNVMPAISSLIERVRDLDRPPPIRSGEGETPVRLLSKG